MYKIIICISLFLLSACSSTLNTTATIEFHDTQGVTYNSISAGTAIMKSYSLNSEPTTIILATNNIKSSLFTAQLNNLNELNAEHYEYITVISNTKKINKSGYYTSTDQAKSILNGKAFKILIFNGQGSVTIESTTLISSNKLKTHLTSLASGR